MTPHPEKMRILVVAGDAESAQKTIELHQHMIPDGAEIIVEGHSDIRGYASEYAVIDDDLFLYRHEQTITITQGRLRETVPHKRASAVSVIADAPELPAPRAHQGLRERQRRLRQAERNRRG